MAIPKAKPAPAASTQFNAGDLASLIRDASPNSTSSKPSLPIAPNFPFFLLHWPQNWNVETEGLDAPTWLPYLSRHVILPGCNGNRTLRRGEKPEAAFDLAVLTNTRRGATYIDPERHRLPSGGRYLREADCRNPRNGAEGVFYLDAWTTPRDVLPGRRLRFNLDRGGLDRFRLHLVEQGILRAPGPSLLSDLIRRKRKALDRVKALTSLDAGEYSRRVQSVEHVLQSLEGARVPAALAGASGGIPSSPGSVPDSDEAEVA